MLPLTKSLFFVGINDHMDTLGGKVQSHDKAYHTDYNGNERKDSNEENLVEYEIERKMDSKTIDSRGFLPDKKRPLHSRLRKSKAETNSSIQRTKNDCCH